MSRFWIILIAVGASSCAATVSPSKSPPSVGQNDAGEYFRPINPESPPVDGLYLSWDDAKRLVTHEQERDLRIAVEKVHLQKQVDLAEARRDAAEKKSQELQKNLSSWWQSWAFPLGMIGGMVLSGVIFWVAVK